MTIYGYSRTIAQVGQLEDTSIRTNDSFVAEEVIEFGLPLMRGSDPEKQVKKFNGGITTKFLGVSAYSATRTEGSYAVNSNVRVLSMGKIWIPLFGTQTVVAGDTAYLNITDDIITNVLVPNETFPIGRFVTGGATTPSAPLIFCLEIEAGFEE